MDRNSKQTLLEEYSLYISSGTDRIYKTTSEKRTHSVHVCTMDIVGLGLKVSVAQRFHCTIKPRFVKASQASHLIETCKYFYIPMSAGRGLIEGVMLLSVVSFKPVWVLKSFRNVLSLIKI